MTKDDPFTCNEGVSIAGGENKSQLLGRGRNALTPWNGGLY